MVTDHSWDAPDAGVFEISRSAALAILKAPGCSAGVTAFYNPNGNYAGSTFHDLEPLDCYRVTASDLLAVTLMNVAVQPAGVRRILEDDGNKADLEDALHSIPPRVSLADADSVVLNAAADFYELLKRLLKGNKWVTASKIAARKRPLLIPVRDRVVVDKLQLENTNFRDDWTVMRALMRDEAITAALSTVRAKAAKGLPAIANVPDLRLFDTAVWMDGRPASDVVADEDE